MRDKNILFSLLLSIIFCFSSCDREDTGCADGSEERYTLAVIMPGNNDKEWHRTVEWAIDNIRRAQQRLDKKIALNIEWHDEDSPDLTEYIKKIAEDNSISAVIGPKSSSKARTVADILSSGDKPLILPIATSTELQREYATAGNIWNLAQSDMTQCEILLTQAKLSGSRYVSLLTSSDEYGKSFNDWFGYQALELGLHVRDIYIYDDERDIRESVGRMAGTKDAYATTLIFAPSHINDFIVLDSELAKLRKSNGKLNFPSILCADVVNSSEAIGVSLEMDYEGISPSANPMSGFIAAYREKFGEDPVNGESHLFDAISMVAYGLMWGGKENLNNNLHLLLENKEGIKHSWLPDDMAYTFRMIRNGDMPNLSGVTGDWKFDKKYGTTVLNSTYSHWVLRNGHFTTIEYLSTDGVSRTTSTLQAWDTQANAFQQFTTDQRDYDYGELHDNWAVVISTSDTWANYRHQADALAMYQLLKRHGYDDSHIILIMEDNIAYDPQNIYPGRVMVTPDGENLYENVKVDYKLSELDLDVFQDIMTGHESNGRHTVLSSGKNDNVIVFWTGHGANSRLLWGSHGEIWSWQVRDLISKMCEEDKFRKMMFVMDACYSGTIGEACVGIPGVLFLTSANPFEPSKADIKDREMGIWLSNGFTRVFQETIDANPDITLRELYYTVARHTVGSHATIYNAESYGNMHVSSFSEYLLK